LFNFNQKKNGTPDYRRLYSMWYLYR
jgi:hypothetical protein